MRLPRTTAALSALALTVGATGFTSPTHAQATQISADVVALGNTLSDSVAGEAMRRTRTTLASVAGDFAPDARLAFHVRPAPDLVIADLRLSIIADGITVPLTLDAEGLAILPFSLADTTWALRIEGASGRVGLRPVVMSPDTSLANRRIGDLRVQCRLLFAMAGDAMAAATLDAFNQMGGCAGQLFEFNVRSDRPIARATIDGSTPLDLVRNGEAVRVPISDPLIGNDARLQLTYRN